MSDATEWVSFVDGEHNTWLFDRTFLESGWSCTFGTLCPGTEPGDNGARGCCAHGAHLVDDGERELITNLASRLDPTNWQNHDLATTDDELFDTIDGETVTRSIDEACIFLNTPGFSGGHGCALHIGALQAGEIPMDWKPAVCWQVPFRFEEYRDGSGTITYAVRAWRRSDWGEGGAAFQWWCTEDLPEGRDGERTWQHHEAELRALVGDEPVNRLIEYLSARTGEVAVKID